MLDLFDDDRERKNDNQNDNYEMIGKGIGLLLIVVFILTMLPIFIASIVVALLLITLSKFKNIKYTKLIIGIFFTISCICIVTNYQIITSFSDIINIPILTDFIKSRLGASWFDKSLISYIYFISVSIVIGTVIYKLVDFYKSRKIETKEDLKNERLKDSLDNVKSDKIYKKNLKLQSMYRKNTNQKEILLGIDNFSNAFVLNKKELNAHGLVVGTTGSGKTTLLLNIVESFAKSNLPGIFIDGKGDPKTIREINNVAKLFNRKTYVFNEKNNLTYNPLKNGNRTVVVDRLMNIFDWSEEYYQSQARNILLKIVMFIDDYGLNRDLKTLNKMLSVSNIIDVLENDYITDRKKVINKIPKASDPYEKEEDLSHMTLSEKKEYLKNKSTNQEQEYEEVEEIQEVKTHSEKYYRYSEIFFDVKDLQHLSDDELKDVKDNFSKRFNGLKAQIENLLLTDIGELVEDKPEGLDIEDVIKEKAILIFSFETVKYPEFMKTFSRFVIEDIATVLSGQFGENTETLIVADEFGAYGTSRIIDLLARLRSAGLHALIGTQTINDLTIDGIDLSGKIFGNTNTYFIGKVNDDEEADRLSKLFGTYEDIDITSQTEDSIESKFIRRDVRANKGTIRNVNKFHTKPDYFKSLSNFTFYTYRKSNTKLNDDERYSKVYVRENQKGIERSS